MIVMNIKNLKKKESKHFNIVLRVSGIFHVPAAYEQSLIPRRAAKKDELSNMTFSTEKINGLNW